MWSWRTIDETKLREWAKTPSPNNLVRIQEAAIANRALAIPAISILSDAAYDMGNCDTSHGIPHLIASIANDTDSTGELSPEIVTAAINTITNMRQRSIYLSTHGLIESIGSCVFRHKHQPASHSEGFSTQGIGLTTQPALIAHAIEMIEGLHPGESSDLCSQCFEPGTQEAVRKVAFETLKKIAMLPVRTREDGDARYGAAQALWKVFLKDETLANPIIDVLREIGTEEAAGFLMAFADREPSRDSAMIALSLIDRQVAETVVSDRVMRCRNIPAYVAPGLELLMQWHEEKVRAVKAADAAAPTPDLSDKFIDALKVLSRASNLVKLQRNITPAQSTRIRDVLEELDGIHAAGGQYNLTGQFDNARRMLEAQKVTQANLNARSTTASASADPALH